MHLRVAFAVIGWLFCALHSGGQTAAQAVAEPPLQTRNAGPRWTASTTEPTADWPRWRGPNADGVADGRDLPSRWSQTEGVRWSRRLPGWGTSSPVVYRGRVFVTSQQLADGKKSLLTLCCDRTDGRELWRHDFGFGVDQRTNPKSNLAANTPAVTEDAVYVAFGNADIARYSHEGKLIWVTR
jgi:outer membrane protein assembly factor BamB